MESNKGEELYQEGKKYFYGEGVSKNYRKAAELFINAANEKNAKAMYAIALCFYEGKGVNKNFAKYSSYLRHAVNFGCRQAQFELGRTLFKIGERKDGLLFLTLSSIQGYEKAILELDTYVAQGLISEKERKVLLKEAHKKEKDLIRNRETYVRLDPSKEIVEPKKTSVTKSKSDKPKTINTKKLRREYYKKGYNYELGIGVENSIALAVSNYKKAAELGSIGALVKLGELSFSQRYSNSVMAKLKLNNAYGLECFTKAKDTYVSEYDDSYKDNYYEDRQLLFRLGTYYYKGQHAAKDIKLGQKIIEFVAKFGCTDAQVFLAREYYFGSNREKNINKALEWYGKAHIYNTYSNDYAEDQYIIACLLSKGYKMDDHLSKMFSWMHFMQESAKHGYPKAIQYLKGLEAKQKAKEEARKKAEESRKKAEKEAELKRLIAERKAKEAKKIAEQNNHKISANTNTQPPEDPSKKIFHYTRLDYSVRYYNERTGNFGLNIYDADVDVTITFKNGYGQTDTKRTSIRFDMVGYNSIRDSDIEYRVGYLLGDY